MDRSRHQPDGFLAPEAMRPARSRLPVAEFSSRMDKIQAIAVLALTAFLAWTVPSSTMADSQCNSSPMPDVDWRECSKRAILLPGSNLERANLFDTDFTMTDLSDANLNSANLEKASLVRAWLTGATAENANFSRIEGYRTGFTNVVANGANFSSAELQRADFTGAKLKGANFEKAELGRALFDGATLANTRFSLANLSRADFSRAIFNGPVQFDRAFMFLARIEGLDLTTAEGLDQAQIDLACGNAETKLPRGLVAPSTWPCQFD